jgi:hypothetical protein
VELLRLPLFELNIMRDEGKKWDMNAYKPSNDQSITAYVTDILEGGGGI